MSSPEPRDAPGVGVSFVVPVRDGERWLDQVLSAILGQDAVRPMEVLVVDDRSRDGSRAIARRHAANGPVRVIEGAGRGAAAAINLGIRHAAYPLVCQVDQDVIPGPGWAARLTAALASPGVAAAQGYYVTPPDGTVWARVMGRDLEQRYRRLPAGPVDHVCTGNSAYRRDALREVGLFDESLGYGYDNDMSYRLGQAGYRLAHCPEAASVHQWRSGARGYLTQQYGVAYGRLDVLAKHPGRVTGDDVAGASMLAHFVGAAAALLLGAAALVLHLAGGAWRPVAGVALGLLGLLAVERLVAGVRAAITFRDPVGLWFAPIHLLRDLAWITALAVWAARRARGRPSRPSDSM